MKYITIYCKYLPLGKESNAMAVWPFVIVKKSRRPYYTVYVERHERIHLAQQQEVGAVGIALALIMALTGCGLWSLLAVPLFFWFYALSFLINFGYCWDLEEAYQRIPFEAEAYACQYEIGYEKRRKHFAWMEYI